MPFKKIKDVFTEKDHQDFLRKKGYDLEAKIDVPHGTTKTTILHDAIVEGHTDIIELLIKEKINLDEFDKHEDVLRSGYTPILLAIQHKKTDALKLLLDNKADPNKPFEEGGKTPLMLAAIKGNEEALDLLLKIDKVDINQENTSPDTSHNAYMNALMYSARYYQLPSIKFLLDHPKIAKKTNSKGKNFIDFARYDKFKEEIRAYIKLKEEKSTLKSKTTDFSPAAKNTLQHRHDAITKLNGKDDKDHDSSIDSHLSKISLSNGIAKEKSEHFISSSLKKELPATERKGHAPYTMTKTLSPVTETSTPSAGLASKNGMYGSKIKKAQGEKQTSVTPKPPTYAAITKGLR